MTSLPIEAPARIQPVVRRKRAPLTPDDRHRQRPRAEREREHDGESNQAPWPGPNGQRNVDLDDLAPSVTVGHIVNTFALPPDVYVDSRIVGSFRGSQSSRDRPAAHRHPM